MQMVWHGTCVQMHNKITFFLLQYRCFGISMYWAFSSTDICQWERCGARTWHGNQCNSIKYLRWKVTKYIYSRYCRVIMFDFVLLRRILLLLHSKSHALLSPMKTDHARNPTRWWIMWWAWAPRTEEDQVRVARDDSQSDYGLRMVMDQLKILSYIWANVFSFKCKKGNNMPVCDM